MRNLLLSSSFLLFLSCSQSLYPEIKSSEISMPCNFKVFTNLTKIWYKASVNITGKTLSGLLLLKKMPDLSQRIVFTSQTGATFFDIEFSKDGFHPVYTMEIFNKTQVLRLLEKDFGLLLQHQNAQFTSGFIFNEPVALQKDNNHDAYYFSDNNCQYVTRIEYSSKTKKKIIFNLTEYDNGNPGNILINHTSFSLSIHLQSMNI